MAAPGVVLVVPADLTIASVGIRTVVTGVQAGKVPPGGQLFPGALETAVALSVLLPVRGC